MTNHHHLRERAEASVRTRDAYRANRTQENWELWREAVLTLGYQTTSILELLAELEAAKKDAARWRAGMDKVRKTFLEKEGEWRNHAFNYTIGASEIFQGCANELSDAIDAALNPAREDV